MRPMKCTLHGSTAQHMLFLPWMVILRGWSLWHSVGGDTSLQRVSKCNTTKPQKSSQNQLPLILGVVVAVLINFFHCMLCLPRSCHCAASLGDSTSGYQRMDLVWEGEACLHPTLAPHVSHRDSSKKMTAYRAAFKALCCSPTALSQCHLLVLLSLSSKLHHILLRLAPLYGGLWVQSRVLQSLSAEMNSCLACSSFQVSEDAYYSQHNTWNSFGISLPVIEDWQWEDGKLKTKFPFCLCASARLVHMHPSCLISSHCIPLSLLCAAMLLSFSSHHLLFRGLFFISEARPHLSHRCCVLQLPVWDTDWCCSSELCLLSQEARTHLSRVSTCSGLLYLFPSQRAHPARSILNKWMLVTGGLLF